MKDGKDQLKEVSQIDQVSIEERLTKAILIERNLLIQDVLSMIIANKR